VLKMTLDKFISRRWVVVYFLRAEMAKIDRHMNAEMPGFRPGVSETLDSQRRQ